MCQRLAVPFLLIVQASLGYCPPSALRADTSLLPSWLKCNRPARQQQQQQQQSRGVRRDRHGRPSSVATATSTSCQAYRSDRGRNHGVGRGTGGRRGVCRSNDGGAVNGAIGYHHTSDDCAGGGGGFAGWSGVGRRRRTGLRAKQVSGGERTEEQEKARAAHRARVAARPKAPPREHVPPPPNTQALNVVLTHTTADFDTLAAAVGLAKLWQDERPDDAECCVCIPRGTHPVVKRFLALHKNLFPIKALRDIDHDRVFRVGLVDAQRLDRIGPAASLVANATEVHVVDHHLEQTTDINATLVVIEQVGSVSTIITEQLQERGLQMKEAEATLLALGVHSDTGSLTFDTATARDAVALAWLMEQGSSQQAIAEYGNTALSPEQQSTLTECINNLNRTSLNGATVSTAVVQLDSYVNGMATVAQNVLDVTDSDVFMLGAHFPQKLGRDPTHMVLIGRARPRVTAVNLDSLMSKYGGGGHRKAAAASLRLDAVTMPGGEPATAAGIVQASSPQDLVDRIFVEQIKELEVAEDIMTAPVQTCGPTETLDEISKVLAMHDIRGMPVVDEEGRVLGLISYKQVEKTMKLGRQHELVRGWMKEQFAVADVRDPLHEMEEKFIKGDLGRIPVLRDGKLVGLITRADMLRQHHFYEGLHYENRAFATPVDSPVRKMLANLRKTLKKYDDE
ncbi:unnamed protein product [Pylaiella littoralis]